MKKSLSILLLSASSLLAGELPELFEKPWTAWYSGYESTKFHFGVDPDGEAAIIPLKKKDRFKQGQWFKIRPLVEEVHPDGKVVVKQPTDNGWEALTPESDEAEKISFRGTATGGAVFEVHFEVSKSEITCRGGIIDKGSLTEHPIRFAVHVIVPNFHSKGLKDEKLADALKGDRVSFVLNNRDKVKLKGDVAADAAAKEAKDIVSARVDMDGLNGRKLELEGDGKGSLNFFRPNNQPIGKGFHLSWVPDPAKNTNKEAVLTLNFN